MLSFRSPGFYVSSAFALIALLGGASSSEAQVGTGRIGVKPLPGAEVMVKQAPVGVGKVKLNEPAPIEPVRVAALLAITQISQGQLTPQQAWERDLLNANDIVQLLNQPRRLTPAESNEELKRDLAGLLVRYAPATVATPKTLSARVRLELGIYYSSIGDARAIPLCQALIAEKLDGKQEKIPTGAAAEPDNVSLWLGSVIYLAQYYQNVGQWEKAAETWERALKFWQDADWFQSSVRIEAARAYTVTGQDNKAQNLYSQVAQYDDGYFTGLAIHDQASRLIYKGKIKAGQTLLTTFFRQQSASQKSDREALENAVKTGTLNLEDKIGPVIVSADARSNPINIALLTLLSYSYYLEGKFDLAKQYARKSIAQYQSLKNPGKNQGLESEMDKAKGILSWSERWEKQPIIVEPTEIRVLGRWKEKFSWSLQIQTDPAIPLTITVDNPKVHILHADKPANLKEFYFEKQVAVEIARENMGESVLANLIVSSPQFPNFSVRVPLSVRVPK